VAAKKGAVLFVEILAFNCREMGVGIRPLPAQQGLAGRGGAALSSRGLF
jgi:hypothetical protein